MVQLQNSISKRLHHHVLFSMLFDETCEAHRAQILSCSSPRVSVWLTTQLIFLTFWLFSSIFYTTLHTWFKLPHPLITCIPWCVCTYPINRMGIHFLLYVHGNKHTGTHDVICDTFAIIAWDVGFHLGWGQLHAFPSIIFNDALQTSFDKLKCESKVKIMEE
jgi:hypothetical protein